MQKISEGWDNMILRIAKVGGIYFVSSVCEFVGSRWLRASRLQCPDNEGTDFVCTT